MSFLNRHVGRLSALPFLLLPLIACGGSEEPGEPSSPSSLSDPELVVAESRLGEVTAADLDRFILALPANRRPDPTTDLSKSYSDIARRLVVDGLLLDEAVLVGADQDPSFRLLERRIERDTQSETYLRELPPLEPLTEEEVRAVYEENLPSYQREEKRRLSHIYKRFGPEMDREQAVAELEALRQRLLEGEHFDLLAREHSDSETRHNGGIIGEVPRGQFTEDFDRVVFALEERVPSEPVVTGDGAHLFLVWDILEARSFSFEEMRTSIAQQMEAQRQAERRREAAAALPQPEEQFVPNAQEIAQILRLGDPATVLLRIGDFGLTIAQFQEFLLNQRRLLGAQHAPNLPFELLDEIRSREIIYQHLQAEGSASASEEQLERQRNEELALYFARRKMTLWVERRPERIQQHYDNNRMRFASPLRVGLRRLAIPLGDSATTTMAQLEAAKADLDAGRRSLDDLATTFGGEVKDLGVLSAAQVQAIAPRALRFVFLLQPGEHTPPYTAGSALVLFQVTERQDPKARALALVRDQVVQDYLTHYGAAVFKEMGDEMLDEAEFQLYPERLDALAGRGAS